MGFSGKLADLFVEFSAKGAEVLKAKLDEIKASLDKMQAGAEAVGRKAGLAFASLTGTVGGFVTAGFAGSAQMMAMSAQMERLSRGIASMFVPEMQKVIGLVREAANFFQGLSGAQQENIKRWIEGAAAGLAVTMLMPKLFAGLQLVIGGVRALTVAITAGLSSTGIGALLPILGGLTAAFVGMAVGSEVAQHGLGGLFKTFQPVIDSLSKIAAVAMSALQPLFDLAASYFSVVAANIQAAMPIITKVVDIIGAAIGKMAAGLEPLLPLVQQVFASMLDAIEPLIEPIGELVTAFIDILVPAIQIAVMGFAAMMKVVTGVVKVVATLVGWLAKAAAFLLGPVGKLLGIGAKGAAVATGTDLGAPKHEKDAKKEPGRTDVAPGRIGTEAITATIGRLQQAALKVDPQLAEQKKISNHTKRAADLLEKIAGGKGQGSPQPLFGT